MQSSLSLNVNPWRQRYGPWAVVTGASDGIGREFARELAARGFDLVLVARRQPVLQALANELEVAHGIACHVLVADLSTHAGCTALVKATEALDVGLLIAAAGFGTSGEFASGPIEPEREMLALNCAAVLELSWAFARRFVARGRGGMILMSSIVAFQGVARAAHYAATKAWVQSFAEGLRIELEPHGVDVIASAPGPVASGFGARADMKMDGAMSAKTVAVVTLDALGRRATVRPGFLSKLLGGSLATLPRWGRTQVLTQVMSGMTRHQAAHPRTVDRPTD
jgi:hypothetical protein